MNIQYHKQSFIKFCIALTCIGLTGQAYAITLPSNTPSGSTPGGLFQKYFNNMFSGCGTQVLSGFGSDGTPICTPYSVIMKNMGGGAAGNNGNTLYSNGTDWVSSSNIYNDGTNVGIGGGFTPTSIFEVKDRLNFKFDNVAIGPYALQNATAANGHNVGAGYFTLNRLTTGVHNVAIGRRAGEYITTGNNNILIGDKLLIPTSMSPGISNFINIGDVLFGDRITKFIGINTITPTKTLDVGGDIQASGTISGATLNTNNLCVGGSCITKFESSFIGMKEVFANYEEDWYGGWWKTDSYNHDSCNGDDNTEFTCGVSDTKDCWDQYNGQLRGVRCIPSSTFVKEGDFGRSCHTIVALYQPMNKKNPNPTTNPQRVSQVNFWEKVGLTIHVNRGGDAIQDVWQNNNMCNSSWRSGISYSKSVPGAQVSFDHDVSEHYDSGGGCDQRGMNITATKAWCD